MGLPERVNARLRRAGRPQAQLSLDEYASWFSYGGMQYPLLQTTYNTLDQERISVSAAHAAKTSGPVFALILARMQVFSQIRFAWTRMQGSQPGDLFGTAELGPLEKPWPGGVTADLLARMEWDASAAGQAYIRRKGSTLHRLNPSWVIIVMGSQEDAPNPSVAADTTVAGYLWVPPGGKPMFFTPQQVAHYAPLPDPDAHFLGMSWITPVLRELQGDQASTEHKWRFFENAAAQPYTARMLTPAGWARMGDIGVGDQVIGPDGKPRTVLGVYPQGEKDIYRLTFAGGGTTECCEDHVWHVSNAYDRKRGTSRTMTLRELLAAGVRYPSGTAKWAVPLTDPVEYAPSATPLPLDPYLLGALLGDGSFRGNGKGSGGVTFAAAADDADEMQDIVRPLLPGGVTIRRRDRGGWSEFYFKGPGGPKENPLTRKVRDLGLFDTHGRDKAVPGLYMRAPVNDRIALLQGLIDTDGNVNRSRYSSTGVRFQSTSETLARQVRELAESLGGVASCTPEVRRGEPGRRPQWITRINQLPEWIIPVRLARKRTDYRASGPHGSERWRTLVKAELIGRKPAQCIKVDADDGLYVTDDFIVTHNTPNLAIKFDPGVTIDAVRQFKELLEEEHRGVANAFRTLFLGGGADPVTVGSTFRDMDYAVVQGRAESRLASAAGVPPSWVGFAEGLQGSSLNAGNFNSARRRLSDGTCVHLWGNAAASLEPILDPPRDKRGVPVRGASLWYDDRIPFMREDASDRAEIQTQEASTIAALVNNGFTPDSVIKAVKNNDWSALTHSGMLSVQLQAPSSGEDPLPGFGTPAAVPASNGNGNGARP